MSTRPIHVVLHAMPAVPAAASHDARIGSSLLSKKARVQPGRKKGRAARERHVQSAGEQTRRNAAGRQAAAPPDTAKRKTSRGARQDVPQFAPNFTVYVLPPDTVCLYSEDRKFFLHGELYCAHRRDHRQRRQEFSGTRRRAVEEFPPDQIEQALKRTDGAPLHRAGFAVVHRPSTAIGRASVCRRMSPSKILRIAACASRRSTSRARPNSAPP